MFYVRFVLRKFYVVSLKHRSVILRNIVLINQYKFTVQIQRNHTFKYFYLYSTVRQFRNTSFLRLFKNRLRTIMYHPYVEKKYDDEQKMKIRFVFKRRRITRRTTTAVQCGTVMYGALCVT